MDMVEFVRGKQQMKKIEKSFLSNDTVRRRISDMSQDIVYQVEVEIRASKARISLQLDESTDVSNCAYLFVYGQYVHAGELKKEFFICESLETTTKEAEMLEK